MIITIGEVADFDGFQQFGNPAFTGEHGGDDQVAAGSGMPFENPAAAMEQEKQTAWRTN